MAVRWRPVSVRVGLLGDAQGHDQTHTYGGNVRWTVAHQAPLRNVELETKLGVADPDLVEVAEHGLAAELPAVQERPVGRVQVLDVVRRAARVDAGVDARGEAVLDPDVGLGPAPDREAAEQVEPLAGLEAPPLTTTSHASVDGALPPGPATWWKPVASGAGVAVRFQLLHRASRDPEQEQVQHGEEAELEPDRDRLGIHQNTAVATRASLLSRQTLTGYLPGLDVEGEVGGADLDLVPRREPRRVHLAAVDLDPVGRAQVRRSSSPPSSPARARRACARRWDPRARSRTRASGPGPRPARRGRSGGRRARRSPSSRSGVRSASGRRAATSAAWAGPSRPSCAPAPPAPAPRPGAAPASPAVWIPNSPRRRRSSVSSFTSGLVRSA